MQVPNYSIYGVLKCSNSILIKVRTCITSKADLFKHCARQHIHARFFFIEAQFTSLVSIIEPYIISYLRGIFSNKLKLISILL